MKLFFINKRLIKVVYSIFAVISTICILDFILEYPGLCNLEIIFKKSFAAKYNYASLKYQNELKEDEIIEIFLMIIEQRQPYCHAGYFDNHAGYHLSGNSYRVAFSGRIKNKIKKYWEDHKQKNMFFSDLSDVTNSCNYLSENFQYAITFSPIKQIDAKIYIGFEEWNAPSDSRGGIYEIQKQGNKWVLIDIISGWIS